MGAAPELLWSLFWRNSQPGWPHRELEATFLCWQAFFVARGGGRSGSQVPVVYSVLLS